MTDRTPRTAARLLADSTTGAVLGVACAALLMLAVVGVAVVTGAHAVVPGVFSAQAGQESGALAVSFTPQGTGLLVVSAVVAVAYVVSAGARRRP